MALSTIALVLLLSAIGASTASSNPNDGVQWKPRPRMEYEFELSGRSLAGLPALQGQYSGVHYGGRVRVQGLTADTAIVRLEKMSWNALHARMQSGWWSGEPQGNATLAGHGHMGAMPMPLSGAAAVARFHDGQVQTVLVSREARDWEVNLLQGVLGHMQIQAGSAGNSLHGKKERQTEQGVYRVLENGVSGRCMVQYEVSPANAPAEQSAAEAKMCAGKPYVQITKTKNFTDCEQFAEQSRGLPRCSPAGNSCASLWARNTLTQLVGCGSGADLQLVQAVSSSSMQAELQTREDSRAVVHSSVNMTLVRVQPVRERLPTPKDGVVLNGLGYRVAGKQVNGDFGLDSDYSSSQEDSDESDSVEVVRHTHQQHQDDDSSSSSSDSDNTSESASESAQKQHKKASYQKNKAHKHKNQQQASSSSSSEEDSASAKHNSRKHKNQQQSSSFSSSEESNAKHHNSRKHKNQQSASSSEESNAKHHNSRKHKNQHESSSSEDSSDSASAKHNSHHHKNQHPSPASEQFAQRMKQAKHSRKPRSAKAGSHKQQQQQQQQAGDFSQDDVFAGALAPAAVQQNATLRAALQKRLVEEVAKAGSELRRDDGPAPRTMERVSVAIRLARALTADQLRAVRDQLHAQEAKELFRDVVAMCGSAACVQETVTAIKERKMTAVAAQMALASLADRVAVPTRTVLKYVQDLYQSSNDQQVKIAAALAMGNMAGRAPRAVAASAADFLAEQLAKAYQAHGKSAAAALRAPLASALGSTATPQAAEALIQVAKNARNAPYQRAQAVLALRASAQRAPAVVRDALLALFHNPTEPAPVRMAAVSLLVYLRPSLPLWQRIALSTFYEPNMAVSSYVWATVHSFAQLQDPAFRQQTQYARLVLPLTRALPQGAHLAFNVVAASVDAQLDRMVHEHASMMAPADAANAYYRRVARRAGVASLDQEVDLWGASPDDLAQAAMDAAFGAQDKAAARPAVDPKAVPAFHATRTIHDKLNIVRRRMQDPRGHLRLTLRPFVNSLFLPFDKDTPSKIAKAAGNLMSQLHAETRFQAQQMGGEELSLATVTEMGFPVNFRVQAPWLVRAEGSAQLHRNHSAQANITCLYTSGLSAQLSVQPSWTNREYLAAVNGHALIQLPATSVRAQMNATDGRVSIRVEPGHNAGSRVLARVATQPLTSAVDLSRGELASESAAAHNASRDASLNAMPAQTVELSPWEDVSLSLRAPVDRAALVAWLRGSRTVLGFPVLGRPLTASRLELVAARPRAFNVSIALVKAMAQSGDLQVVYPASLAPQDAPQQPEYPGTTTEYPATSSTTEYPSTTTEYPSTTATPAVVRTPRASNGAHAGRGSNNGSLYMDDGDVDFSRSLFNATTLNPYANRVNGSAELYVLSQLLAGMSAGRAYVVGVNVTAEAAVDKAAATYSAFGAVGANLGGRLMRAGLFARSDADNAQMAATGAVLRDVAARSDLHAALRHLPGWMLKAEYQQVDASAVKKVLTAAVETDRSFAKTRRVEQAALEQYCIHKDNNHAAKNVSASVNRVCREILGAANTPDQFNATLNYNAAAEESWGAAMHGALQAARAYLWNQDNIVVDTLATGNSNELGAGVTVQADGTVNGWLQTPRTLTKMSGTKAPVAATLVKAANQETGDFCGVSASRLVTLDGASGAMQLSDCWHLLAKDCSGKSRVAVLARADKARAEHQHLEVEINVDNYQIARLYPDGSATLNGVAVANSSDLVGAAVQVRDADDVNVMDIVRGEDGALNVRMADHGMSLVYGNSSVVIQAGASLRGRLCGMCGNFDASSTGDLLSPANKALKTVQGFADSYVVKDAQCGKGRQ